MIAWPGLVKRAFLDENMKGQSKSGEQEIESGFCLSRTKFAQQIRTAEIDMPPDLVDWEDRREYEIEKK